MMTYIHPKSHTATLLAQANNIGRGAMVQCSYIKGKFTFFRSVQSQWGWKSVKLGTTAAAENVLRKMREYTRVATGASA